MSIVQQIVALWKKGGAKAEVPTEVGQVSVPWGELSPATREGEQKRIEREIAEMAHQRERAAALDAKVRSLVSKGAADVLSIGALTTQWNRSKLNALEELVSALESGAPAR